jgi:hypothetical protein
MGVRNKFYITVTNGVSSGFMSSTPTNLGNIEIVVSGLHFIST